MKNIMLDIETLGIKPGSVIISMAAIAFDLETGNTGMSFERRLDVSASIRKGFRVEGDTLKWWLSQKFEIMRSQFEFPSQPQNVLVDFRNYIVNQFQENDGLESVKIWANSPSFDCALLRSYYERYEVECPWKFYDEMDVRTITHFEPQPWLKKNSDKAHDPLYDCQFQIERVMKVMHKVIYR